MLLIMDCYFNKFISPLPSRATKVISKRFSNCTEKVIFIWVVCKIWRIFVHCLEAYEPFPGLISCHPPFIKFPNKVKSDISAGSRSEVYIGRLSFLDHDGYRNYLFLLMQFLNRTFILSCSIIFSVCQIETELIRCTKQKLI